MLAPMALAQRARDALMARALLDADADGAVLIAGAGHARTDRGVPYHLKAQKPGLAVVSIAWIEVDRDAAAPPAYAGAFAADRLPFDYVWFTPRANDDDPCAAFGK
jgi:uncharacterized iron-regulated protein